MNRSKKLKELLYSERTEYIMEAHNGVSAKIVEKTGFGGIWASGLTMSASLGMRDNNELSWTQICDMCEFMARVTDIPILLDGDTGYGDFNNFRLLIEKLERIGIAGVCIEDKIFPKTCSFVNSNEQKLATISEVCGKIRAGRETCKNKDFVIVARTEAFIVGEGVEEALSRAMAYAENGADAVLIHSKRKDMAEIEEFMRRWDNRVPVIIVPTKYYQEEAKKFEALGISLVIWANHNLRTSITAMENVSKQIYEERTLKNVENNIASLDKVFELQNLEEYLVAKEKYV